MPKFAVIGIYSPLKEFRARMEDSQDKNLDHVQSGRSIWRALSVALASLSLISIVQHWGQVPLASYLQEAIETYRAATSTIKWIVLDWWLERIGFRFNIPLWTIDVTVLWSLSLLGADRFTLSWANLMGSTGSHRPFVKRVGWVGFLFAPIVLWAQIFGYYNHFLRPSGYQARYEKWLDSQGLPHEGGDRSMFRKQVRDSRRIFIASSTSALLPLLVTIAFFVWNGIII